MLSSLGSDPCVRAGCGGCRQPAPPPGLPCTVAEGHTGDLTFAYWVLSPAAMQEGTGRCLVRSATHSFANVTQSPASVGACPPAGGSMSSGGTYTTSCPSPRARLAPPRRPSPRRHTQRTRLCLRGCLLGSRVSVQTPSSCACVRGHHCLVSALPAPRSPCPPHLCPRTVVG